MAGETWNSAHDGWAQQYASDDLCDDSGLAEEGKWPVDEASQDNYYTGLDDE